MTKLFNNKALDAFKKLGTVAIITATTLMLAMFFTACKQTSGGGKPKHEVTFGVEGGNGELYAKVDGMAETKTCPINVEEGKTVTFTAKANDGYRVKGWTLDGNAVNGTNTEYKLTVTKVATISVSFEAIPPTKYKVTFTQTEHGKVTASPEIPEDGLVVEGTEITFTAKADTGYMVNKWSILPSEALQSGGKKGNEIAKLKITADTTVSVSFVPTYVITFSVEGGTGGTLKAKADGIDETSTSPITVEEGKTVTFTATANTGYKIGKWTVTGSVLEAGTGADGSETAKVKITADTTVTVSFELKPVEGGAVLILSPDKPTIKVKAKTEDGSAIVVEGCTETTLASDTETTLTATGTRVVLKGKITELYCNGSSNNNRQPLTALNVQGLTSLQVLNCEYNQLTALDVQGLTSLRKLGCWTNQLTALNVQGLTALQVLACSSNQLTELNVQGLTALQELNCSWNQLTALNVQGLTSLQKLDCSINQLTALNLQGLTSLQKLECSYSKLTELNVQGCTALQRLWCHYNQFTELNVQGCVALQMLSCFGNKLNAQAMTELLQALPAREASDDARAFLYTDMIGLPEGNHKDFTQPEDLKKAFDGAKSRNWKLRKMKAYGREEDL